MPANYRLLRMPSGRMFKAKIVPHYGLGTMLDQFFWERRIDPGDYDSMRHQPMGHGSRWVSNRGRQGGD